MATSDHSQALERIRELPSWLAGRVAARGRGLVVQAIAAEDIKLAHLAALAAVSQYGPLTQADLVRRLEIDAKDVAVLLNRLEQTGHVKRDRDPRDRRKNAVSVTEAGAKALQRSLKLAEEANEELLAPLSADERRQFTVLLAKVQAGRSS
jgi:DNA-binding MarR family transcriptional regulator